LTPQRVPASLHSPAISSTARTSGVKTGLVYSGTGFLNLAGTSATNYSGGFSFNSGTVRITTANSLGAAGNVVTVNGGTLEIRSDTNVAYAQPLTDANGGTIAVGQMPGGTGATGAINKTISLGALTSTVTGKNHHLRRHRRPAGQRRLQHLAHTVNANVAATTLNNVLALPGVLSIGNVTATATGTNVLTIGGVGGFTNISGDITNGGSTSVGLGFTGSGVLNLNGTVATNYTGGLNINAGGIVRVNSAQSLGSQTTLGTLTLQAGTLDVRMDGNSSFANPIVANGTNNFTINADRAVGGSGSGGTVTFTAPFCDTAAPRIASTSHQR